MAYTVQQIKAALKLYDRLKKIVPTVRQLGYPTAHTLYEWINLYLRNGTWMFLCSYPV